MPNSPDELEAPRELGDDPVAQLVGHLQDVPVDRFVVADVRGLVAGEAVRQAYCGSARFLRSPG
jgi:hypothetical protein